MATSHTIHDKANTLYKNGDTHKLAIANIFVLYKMELTLLRIKGPLTIMDSIYSLIHTPYI